MVEIKEGCVSINAVQRGLLGSSRQGEAVAQAYGRKDIDGDERHLAQDNTIPAAISLREVACGAHAYSMHCHTSHGGCQPMHHC